MTDEPDIKARRKRRQINVHFSVEHDDIDFETVFDTAVIASKHLGVPLSHYLRMAVAEKIERDKPLEQIRESIGFYENIADEEYD
jgi:hypothetical protein